MHPDASQRLADRNLFGSGARALAQVACSDGGKFAKGSGLAEVPIENGGENIDLGELSNLAGYHLRRASGAFATDFSRALAGTGMRQVLFGVLSLVGANPGINQGTVGRHLGIQRANMVSLINEVIDLGLVERCVAAEDRRAFALSLSPSGKHLLQRCLVQIQAHESKMLADLTTQERTQLLMLLQKLGARAR